MMGSVGGVLGTRIMGEKTLGRTGRVEPKTEWQGCSPFQLPFPAVHVGFLHRSSPVLRRLWGLNIKMLNSKQLSPAYAEPPRDAGVTHTTETRVLHIDPQEARSNLSPQILEPKRYFLKDTKYSWLLRRAFESFSKPNL